MSTDQCDKAYDDSISVATDDGWDPLDPTDLQIDTLSNKLNSISLCSAECYSDDRVRALEEEQELLNASLFELTTHFAQVQFRLRQVVEAPSSEKEELLKSLEEFAFRGVTDTTILSKVPEPPNDLMKLHPNLSQRNMQLNLIEQLKYQLEELENCTIQTRHEVPKCLLEKQRTLIDELKHKLNDEDIEGTDDETIFSLKLKEQLVNQFKTQIADLERFILFLQDGPNSSRCTCSCPVHGASKALNCQYPASAPQNHTNSDPIRNHTIGIMKKAATILQMFIVMQFGCGTNGFKKNNLKACYNHWGDLRARLEIVVGCIEDLMKSHMVLNSYDSLNHISGYGSDLDEDPSNLKSRLTSLVRKQLAPTIRDLIEHGLIECNDRTSVVPFIMCFSTRTQHIPKTIHAWEIVLEYYKIKNGEIYNTTPARKLSQSFNLELAEVSCTNKQALLSTIGSIIATHAQYKRSYDSHFKAFISAALNANKLVIWLTLILQCNHLIRTHYHPWSYVRKTGFQDSLQSLERLTKFVFDLPVDLAVRHFQNIKDVFM